MRKVIAAVFAATILLIWTPSGASASPGRTDCVSISSSTTLCSHEGITYVVVCDPDCTGYRA